MVICAGGPSLRGFCWDRLRGLNVIAINRAYEQIPFAPVLWWSDARFWRNNRDGLTNHSAPWKATFDVNYGEERLPSSVHRYQFSAVDGFDERPTYLRTGNNSAYAALHLAVHLGARLIVLLGVDMRHGENGETHYHDGHRGFRHLEQTLTRQMSPHFATIAEPLMRQGVEVINASPKSALTIWPRCSIDEGLAAIQMPDFGRKVAAM